MKREKKPREDKNKSERRRRSTGEGKRGEKKYKRETTTVVQFYQFIISYQIQYKIRFK
jgi:hypothetical protein